MLVLIYKNNLDHLLNFASLYIVAAAALCLWTFGIDFAFAVYC